MPTLPSPTSPTSPTKSKTELIEVQSKQLADQSERLGLLNEVVAKRQEEADALRHELMQTQARIHDLTRQWEQQQKSVEERFAAWKQSQEEGLAQRQNDLNKTHRQAQESLQRTQAFEEESRLKLIQLNVRDEEYRRLAQDRIDISQLRAKAEAKMQEAQTLWGHAQHTQNQATAVMADAVTVKEDCERRNQEMVQAWDKCRAWEEEVRLKARDVEMQTQELRRQEAIVKALQAEKSETTSEPALT